MDGHALCVSGAARARCSWRVRMGLFRSDDQAQTWRDMEVGRFSPLTYARDVRVSPHDASTLYACLSPAARSQDGSLYRSEDLGQTWRALRPRRQGRGHDDGARAQPARSPTRSICASRNGQVFGTVDGGATWREHRLPAAVRDVYALACG